jgi:hypothetical protein
MLETPTTNRSQTVKPKRPALEMSFLAQKRSADDSVAT